MNIAPNHKTFVRIEKPLSACPVEIGNLFQSFHDQLGRWCKDTPADIQCEAHARGVTYMTGHGSKAFVWINFQAKFLSVFIPGINPVDYPGSKPTSTTPGNRPGVLITIKQPHSCPR